MSGTSAAVFRIGFGGIGLLLVARFFANGWIEELYIHPAYHFPYPGFEWVRPWPSAGMYLHLAVMGFAAVGIALGFRYRTAALTFALGLAYLELIDRTYYLNHYYWMALTAALIAFLPLDSRWAIGRRSDAGRTISMNVVWLLRFQVGVVYLFAGLAKLNPDWLLHGEPLATWLPSRSEIWLIGPLLALPTTALLLSWAGAWFDLTVIGWLSYRRTRLPAFMVLVAFHVFTWLLFPSIGVFPLLMSLGATVFFDPDWPELAIGRRSRPYRGTPARVSPATRWLVVAYLALMIALPLRHYLIDGDVKWNGDGYLGSWQVMLSEKSGSVAFVVTDPETGDSWRVPPPDYLTPRQVDIMSTDPTMIEQTARLISAEHGGVIVSADARLSFNGRSSSPFTDPAFPIAPDPDPDRAWLVAGPGD